MRIGRRRRECRETGEGGMEQMDEGEGERERDAKRVCVCVDR